MKRLLVLLLLTTGCAGIKVEPGLHINPEFLPYVERFEREAANQNKPIMIKNLTIRFDGKLNGTNTIAECAGGFYPLINFQPRWWDEADEGDKENVVFHELGHCILNLDHDESFVIHDNERIPKSIMYPWALDSYMYLRHRDYYIYEIFN